MKLTADFHLAPRIGKTESYRNTMYSYIPLRRAEAQLCVTNKLSNSVIIECLTL